MRTAGLCDATCGEEGDDASADNSHVPRPYSRQTLSSEDAGATLPSPHRWFPGHSEGCGKKHVTPFRPKRFSQLPGKKGYSPPPKYIFKNEKIHLGCDFGLKNTALQRYTIQKSSFDLESEEKRGEAVFGSHYVGGRYCSRKNFFFFFFSLGIIEKASKLSSLLKALHCFPSHENK